MSRILKVFATGAKADEVAALSTTAVRYDAFVVIETSDAQAKKLAADHLTEDITDQYAIPLGGEAQITINTEAPRITAMGAMAAHPAYKGAKRLSPGPHHYLVQFVGPVKPEWLDAVRNAGGEVVDTHSGFTMIVRATQERIARIAALPEVRWAGHLPPQARVEVTDPAASPLRRTRLLPQTLVAEFFTSAAARKACAAVRALGLRVAAGSPDSEVLVIEQPAGSAAAQRRQLDGLSQVHGVRMVRRRAINRISNDVAVGIMGGSAALAAIPGLDGTGEIVGICDTGLDIGSTSPAHPDFAGRVKSVTSYPITPDYATYIKNPGGDDGAADLDSGHGTHVAGSAVGDGTASTVLQGQQPIRGMAYKAKLVFQAVEQALDWKNPSDLHDYGRYVLAGIPADITPVFAEAYKKGARIHSNSWGGGDPGVYDAQARQLDQFVWDHPNLCIVVAAGNDGSDKDGDGKINLGSVTSPGTAKNCVTIGADESLRTSFNSEHYGDWWPTDYPASPYKGAPMADNPDQVVAFSSRGPTADGRMKPDVIAPGTWILSTKSTMLSPTATGWSPFPPSSRYFYMGGTSMATPLTAGSLAVLRQHLRKNLKIASPTAALLKAALIAGATRLSGTAAPGTVVDPHQGYGRVDVAAIAAPPVGVGVRLWDRRAVSTGTRKGLTIKVTKSSTPLRVVLVYSDYPGPALVNNLNLVVTAPDGTTLPGNAPEAGPATFDTTNNVEVVQVSAPATGTWTIDVIGSNVPRGPQPYALVARGAIA
ncbi:MAG TPA: S8 family serine peptidase [Ilumatobacteraceae bacterium]|nr:S8 family serine peptidase [Ilumatobacteraceae bacterium]